MALQHHAHHVARTGAQLGGHLGGHLALAAIVLVGIAMAAIHHHPRRQAGFGQLSSGFLHRLRVVIGAALTTPQNQVAIGVARGGHDRRLTLPIDAEKMVGPRRRLHCIDGGDGTAISAIFEADRHRQTRGHLPVGLAFGGAGTDGRPADQISDVLGHHRIKQLGSRRQAHLS